MGSDPSPRSPVPLPRRRNRPQSLSLLGLLVLWLAGLMLGWALLYWGLRFTITGTNDFGTTLYYSGTSLLTPAFGTAHGAMQRTLTLVETLTGLGTIALLISYLPALYGAYSKREARLLTARGNGFPALRSRTRGSRC